MCEISIIIPAYNVGQYLDECFESLINQTYKDFEIIVVNDGSTDVTPYMLKRYSEVLDNVTLVNQKNSGSPGGPRNRGIELAKGKYLFMLDPDDILPYNALETLHIAAEKSKADMVAGNYVRFNSRRTWSNKHLTEEIFCKEREVQFREFPELLYNGVTCNKLYRTQYIKENNIRYTENMKNGEDKEFMLGAYLHANKVYILPDIVYKYREREGNNVSATQDYSIKIFKESLQAIIMNYNWLASINEFRCINILFSQVRIRHDLLRFINYYVDAQISKDEWDKVYEISIEYLELLYKSNNKDLSYYERLKVSYLYNKQYDKLVELRKREKRKSFYYIECENQTWVIKDSLYKENLEYLEINSNDLSLQYDIENLEIKQDKLLIDGWAYFNRVKIKHAEQIKKSLVFKSDKDKIEYILQNYDRQDVPDNNKNKIFGYRWSGLRGEISIKELNTIVDGQFPSVKVYLKVEIGEKLYEEVQIDELEVYHYLNKDYEESKKIIQRTDNIIYEELGIRIKGWAALLYQNYTKFMDYEKHLVLVNKENKVETKYILINKYNNWYNTQFSTNPYKNKYDFGGWEVFLPFEDLRVGRFEFYIEIKKDQYTYREKLKAVSATLIKNRAKVEKAMINFSKRFSIQLTTTEYLREQCEMELYVQDIYHSDNELTGGYLPVIGDKMNYWKYNGQEEVLLKRLSVTHTNLILAGTYLRNNSDVQKIMFKLQDINTGQEKIIQCGQYEYNYGGKSNNGWSVRIPYITTTAKFKISFIIVDAQGMHEIEELRISKKVSNDAQIWGKEHFIKKIRLAIVKKSVINTDRAKLEFDFNFNKKNYIEGIVKKGINKVRVKVKKGISRLPKGMKITKLVEKILDRTYVYVYNLACLLPVKNKVLMLAYSSGITQNFEPLYKELQKNHPEITTMYIGGNEKNIAQRWKLAIQLATAKSIVIDSYYRHIYPLKIRNATNVIQIWHATGIFKKFGMLALSGTDSNSKEFEENAHRNYTHIVVSSNYIKKPYAEAFGLPESKTYALGVPRTDMFFDEQYKVEVCNRIYQMYPQFKEKKIILYAPTFRGTPKERKNFRNQLDWEKLYKLKEKGYIIVCKLHPVVEEPVNIPLGMEEFIYDMTQYKDINELFIIADTLITDYSSSIFEFTLLGKPVILFAYDLQQYLLERGFYEDYREFVPGPICYTTEEVMQSILAMKSNKIDYTAFIDKYLSGCDGRSTQRVIEEIILDKKK